MTYFIIESTQKNTLSGFCHRCSLLIMSENPEHTELVADIRAINPDLDFLMLQSTIDALSPKYSNISDILNELITHDSSNKIKTIAYGLSNLSTHMKFASTAKHTLTIKEIKPHLIYHESLVDVDCVHILDTYDTITEWSFGVDFLEHLLNRSLTIAEHGHNFMMVAIRQKDLAAIDFLIKSGVDISCESGSGYTDDILRGYRNYARLVAIQQPELLTYFADQGCGHIEDAISFFQEEEELTAVMSYVDQNSMSDEDKRSMLIDCFRSWNVTAMKMFEKEGLILTKEIVDSLDIDEDDDLESPRHQYYNREMLEYMIHLGINAKHYQSTYFMALIDEDLDTMVMIEKAGIFEHYKPADFLTDAVLNSKTRMLQYLIDRGIDKTRDQSEIRYAYTHSLNDLECMKLLEPFVDNIDYEMLNKMLDTFTHYHIRYSSKCDPVINNLIDRGAKPPEFLLAQIALSNLKFLERILRKLSYFEVRDNVEDAILSKTNKVVLCRVRGHFEGGFNLVEVVVFINTEDDFESTLKLLLEAKPELNSTKLIFTFQKCFELLARADRSEFQVPEAENLVRKAQLLIDYGYLEPTFIKEHCVFLTFR